MSQVQCAEAGSPAQTIGADMIAAMAACFFKPGSVDELIGFFKPIAASASRLPFYYYNMPSITGVSLPVHKVHVTRGESKFPIWWESRGCS